VSETRQGERRYVLFVYGTLLSGEPSHALLDGASPLGAAKTRPELELFDLGPYPAIVSGGVTAISGELYEVATPMLAALDVHEGVPLLFKRRRIELEDGRSAEAYFLDADQVRGRRRIKSGDWRARFREGRAGAGPTARDGAFVTWVRKRER
jgi:gamma-glutamylaminecyclotransferase